MAGKSRTFSLKEYREFHNERIANGLSASEMAEKLGIAKTTYYSGVKRAGIKLDKQPRKPKEPRPMFAEVPRSIEVPIAPIAPAPKKELSVIVIKGDSDEIAKALKNLF